MLRGVQKLGATTVTPFFTGAYASDAGLRAEFYSALGGRSGAADSVVGRHALQGGGPCAAKAGSVACHCGGSAAGAALPGGIGACAAGLLETVNVLSAASAAALLASSPERPLIPTQCTAASVTAVISGCFCCTAHH